MWAYFLNQKLFDQLVVQNFEAVSSAHCQTLIKALYLLNSGELAQLKAQQVIIAEWQTARAGKSLNLRIIKHAIACQHQLKRQLKFARYFNQPDFWQKRKDALLKLPGHKNTAKDYQQFKALKKGWKTHGRYASYSTEDLLHVYQQILPVFTNWLSYARTELQVKRQGLTEELVTAYDTFLTQLADELETEKQQMRASFMARLEAGLVVNDIRFDNVLFILQEQLIALSIWQATDRLILNELQGSIMPNSLNLIQHILEQEATEEERAAFYTLPYRRHFNYQHANAPYRYYMKGGAYYIPSELIQALPVELPFYLKLPKFLHFLFAEEKLRYEFFQQPTCQYLLAIEVAYPPIEQWLTTDPIDLANLQEQRQWQCLMMMLNYLALEKERTQVAKQSLWGWWHADTLQMLNTYEQQLQQKAQAILTKQVELLSTLSTKVAFTEAHKNQLNRQLRQLNIHDQIWVHPISTKLTALAAKQIDVPISQNETFTDALAPIVSSSKPNLREKTIFDRFYADIDNVLKAYQQENPFNTLPIHRQQDIQQLTAILQKNVIEQDAVQLRQDLVSYRENMKSEIGLSFSFVLFDSDLRKVLDEILNQSKYQALLMTAHDQIEMQQRLNQLNYSKTFFDNPALEAQISLIPLKQLNHELTEQPLKKTPTDLRKHLEQIQAYYDAAISTKNLSSEDKSVFNNYLCYYTLQFLKELSELASADAYCGRQQEIHQIISLLLKMSEHSLSTLRRLLISVKNAENHLTSIPWEQFVHIMLKRPIGTLQNYLNKESFVVGSEYRIQVKPSKEVTDTLKNISASTFFSAYTCEPKSITHNQSSLSELVI